MTFHDAQQELVKLAGGRYCSLAHKRGIHTMPTGLVTEDDEYTLYVAPHMVTAESWSEAFDMLRRAIRNAGTPKPCPTCGKPMEATCSES